MRQIIISLFVAIPICCFSQSKYDGKTIDKFYAELKKSPTEKAQWDFFNAFPDNYQDFDKIYTYNSGKNPYYYKGFEHIAIGFGKKLSTIADSILFEKLISLTLGKPYWEADAQTYLKEIIREKLDNKGDVFIRLIDKRSHRQQYEFWWFYWNELVRIKQLYDEKNILEKKISGISSSQVEIFNRAFKEAYGNAIMRPNK